MKKPPVGGFWLNGKKQKGKMFWYRKKICPGKPIGEHRIFEHFPRFEMTCFD